jgi:hypothetical protein
VLVRPSLRLHLDGHVLQVLLLQHYWLLEVLRSTEWLLLSQVVLEHFGSNNVRKVVEINRVLQIFIRESCLGLGHLLGQVCVLI